MAQYIVNHICFFIFIYDNKSKYGYIDKFGNIVIPCVWNELNSFCERLALVKGDNNKYGYITENGNVVVPCMFDSANNYSEGRACTTIRSLFRC